MTFINNTFDTVDDEELAVALALKSDKSETYTKSQVISNFQPTGNYATTTTLTDGLATKAPTGDYATNTSLALKANQTDVDTKANQTDVDNAMGLKANQTDVDTAMGLKANQTDVDTAMGLKANQSGDRVVAVLYISPNKFIYFLKHPEDPDFRAFRLKIPSSATAKTTSL